MQTRSRRPNGLSKHIEPVVARYLVDECLIRAISAFVLENSSTISNGPLLCRGRCGLAEIERFETQASEVDGAK